MGRVRSLFLIRELQTNFVTLNQYFEQEDQVLSIILSLYGQDSL